MPPAWVQTTGRQKREITPGPCPKPLRHVWEAVRRQEPVPGEMSLAPAGRGEGRVWAAGGSAE